MGFYVLPTPIKIASEKDALALVEHLRTKPLLAFDTETTGLVRHKDRALILSLSDGVGRWAIWPAAIPYFKELLENPSLRLIGHIANYDQWMLLNIGIDISRNERRENARVYDTLVMHALVDDASPHDLKYLARYYLDIDMVPFMKVYGAQLRKKRTLTQVLLDPQNEEVTVHYAALDAYATYKLFLVLQRIMERTQLFVGPFANLWEYYTETEVLFTKVLWHMERRGIELDSMKLIARAPEIERELTSIESWFCHKLRRYDLNLNSTPQLIDLFLNVLGHQATSYTAGGAPQINKLFLKGLAKGGCEYATQLLRYRDLTKQLNTYVLGLLDHVAMDGRIHTQYNQTGARTGRLSSASPNLQNQPPYIRDAYVAKKGFVLKALDQQQLEMRILAHVSRDPALCDAIRAGKDVHSATAAVMYKVPYEDVAAAKAKDDAGLKCTPEEKVLLGYRKNSKTIQFGIVYGMGPGKLASSLGVPVEEAKRLIEQYFDAVPGVKEYFLRVLTEARRNGFSSTVMGRRRQLPGIWSSLSGDVARAERQVKNAPIQGFASEIIKVAQNRIFCDPFLVAMNVEMLLQVHDELVFEVPAEYEHDEEINARLQYHMVRSIAEVLGEDLAVPLDTSGKSGANWGDCK